MLQFLDEADLLADNIAVLAAPGKLVANGSPVTLKTSLGEGYSVQVKFSHDLTKNIDDLPDGLLSSIRLFAPEVYTTALSSTQISYHLRSKDPLTVEKVLLMLDRMKDTFGIMSYDVIGTNIEDIFLRLMTPVGRHENAKDKLSLEDDSQSVMTVVEPDPLELTTGQSRAPWHQALVIFQKRLLIARRSWLPQLLLVLVAVAGSTVPTFFMTGRPATCIPGFHNFPTIPLYLPISPLNTLSPFSGTVSGESVAIVTTNTTPILTTPPGITAALGISDRFVPTLNVADNATLIQYVNQNFGNMSLGAFSLEVATRNSLFAWETSNSGLKGSAMLNLGTNILLGRALQTSELPQSIVLANYATFPLPDVGLLPALKWAAFFGAAMVSIPHDLLSLGLIPVLGGIHSLLRFVRCSGTLFIRTGHAAIKRIVEPCRTLARPSAF
jgi:ATP-binding cassette subfamily A (ABC1) protein 3